MGRLVSWTFLFSSILVLNLMTSNSFSQRIDTYQDLEQIIADRGLALRLVERQDYKSLDSLLNRGKYQYSDYTFLWPGEYLLLNLLSNQFGVLDSITELYSAENKKKFEAPVDEVYDRLVKIVRERQKELESKYAGATSELKKISFLNLLLNWILQDTEGEEDKKASQLLKERAIGFIKMYPKSKEALFVSENIHGLPIESNIQVGFSAGVGFDIYQKGLSNFFKEAYYFSLAVHSRAGHSYFYMPIEWGVLKTEQGLESTYRKIKGNENYYSTRFGLNFGYSFQKSKLELVPIGGVSVQSFLNTSDPWIFSYQYGLLFSGLSTPSEDGTQSFFSVVASVYQNFAEYNSHSNLNGYLFSVKMLIGAEVP